MDTRLAYFRLAVQESRSLSVAWVALRLSLAVASVRTRGSNFNQKGGDNSFGGTCGLLREHNENCSMSESFMIERWVHFAELMALAATRSPPLHFSMGGVPLSRLLLAESSSSCSEHHIVPSSTCEVTHLHCSFRLLAFELICRVLSSRLTIISWQACNSDERRDHA